MSFPKKGKFFPKENGYTGNVRHGPDNRFAAEIASTLKRSLGDSRAGAKIVASWTGANEKTVKNWFAGRCGPSGERLVALARHSDEVLGMFLAMAGRKELNGSHEARGCRTGDRGATGCGPSAERRQRTLPRSSSSHSRTLARCCLLSLLCVNRW